ncbi:hypothetical protein BC332_27172 [Capsicum chinense]|nr:hypothetical protein BC332_27172 [Capsicum chinense]
MKLKVQKVKIDTFLSVAKIGCQTIMATTSPSIISLNLLVINSKSRLLPPKQLSNSQISLPNLLISPKIIRKNRRIYAISSSNNFSLAEANLNETADQVVVTSTGDDGVSTVISSLLFIAFIGLSILTIGVIYIAITDFLQKREKEQFEKEEAGKKKKSGRKGKIGTRAKAGPRGFGQKVEESDQDDD